MLELLVSAHGPLGVTEAAEQLGVDKANAHRTLAALVRLGYVEQDPSTRRYGATVRVVELARSVLDSKDLTVVAAPHLKSLWAASGENTHLAVLAGDHVVYVSTLNGTTLLSANAAIGQSGPLHCTATGKAIIANLPARDHGRPHQEPRLRVLHATHPDQPRCPPEGAGPGPRDRLRRGRP